MTSEEEAANPELESCRLLATATVSRRLGRHQEAMDLSRVADSPKVEFLGAARPNFQPTADDKAKDSVANAGVRPDERRRCGCFDALPCKRRQPISDEAATATTSAAAAAAATAAACIARPRCHRPSRLSELANRTHFSREELRRLYRGFKNDCPAGLVRRDAFREIFCQFFPLGDATAYADLFFNSLVLAGEEAVTFDAAILALSAMCRGDSHDRLGWAFRICDADKDGRLTRREVAVLVSAVYDLLGPSVLPQVAPIDVQRHADAVFGRMLLAVGRGSDFGAAGGDEATVTLAEFAVACRHGRDIEREFGCLETLF